MAMLRNPDRKFNAPFNPFESDNYFTGTHRLTSIESWNDGRRTCLNYFLKPFFIIDKETGICETLLQVFHDVC